MDTKVKIKLSDGARMPIYQTSGASGADLHAFLSEPLEVAPGQRCSIPTGVHIELPYGYEVQIRPRSGLAFRQGVTVLNTPGTIDSDYRGEIVVIMINLGDDTFCVAPGDRIAQMVLCPVVRGEFVAVDELGDSARGSGGFGHTGV